MGVVCGEPVQESCDVHTPRDADSQLALSVDVSQDVGSEGGGSEGEGSGGEEMGMEECGRELDGSDGDEYELWVGGGEGAAGDEVGNCGYKKLKQHKTTFSGEILSIKYGIHQFCETRE